MLRCCTAAPLLCKLAAPALQTHLLALSSDLLHSRFTVGADQSAGAGVPKSRSYARPHRDALAVRLRRDLHATRHCHAYGAAGNECLVWGKEGGLVLHAYRVAAP